MQNKDQETPQNKFFLDMQKKLQRELKNYTEGKSEFTPYVQTIKRTNQWLAYGDKK
ncbi:hypothetical protein [Sulfurimonas sp. HSL-1716]|uniref:hypothetical protein n=1 Tax=Hydrocurvibacter sulfurireducens TaxID=3131937 RepID=UPI0031F99250